MSNPLVTDTQPAPIPNERPAVWDLVIADMKARDQEGRKKYGVPLQAFNGRDMLVDAYQEALDLAVYLRALIEERNNPPVRKGRVLDTFPNPLEHAAKEAVEETEDEMLADLHEMTARCRCGHRQSGHMLGFGCCVSTCLCEFGPKGP